MRFCLILAALVGLIVGASPLSAEEEPKTFGIGDVAPAWKDLPGVDDKKHSLADLKDKPVVVVVFSCNSCPVSNDYEDRINAFAKKYADKVAVVAINVNTIPEDRLPKMQERAKEKKYVFPYLFDETQQIGKAFGAVFTPEFFVLDKDRKLVFKGGMDDHSNAELVKKNYLEPAVEAALEGKVPAVTEATSIGCRVRYVTNRRKKK